MIIPVLAGFISRSISDKPGFAAGLVGGMLAISGGSGFIGGIIVGFLAGYLTQGIKYITRKLPQAVEGLKPTLIYPVLSVTITGLLMVYIFNPPASWLNHLLLHGLNSIWLKYHVTRFSDWCNDGYRYGDHLTKRHMSSQQRH